jgi:molybdopterin/thiamine biosynthesis adenylyltransferase
MIRNTIRRTPEGDEIHLIVAAPNPAVAGAEKFHVLCCRFKCSADDPVLAPGPSGKLPDGPQLEWLTVDDCRTGVTTRRDTRRPVEWFRGRNIEIWGCGALGSWIAEQAVRAGVRRLVLRDPGVVSRGLLVRQNYIELDVGKGKASALADRLRTLSDDVTIDAHDEPGEFALFNESGGCELPDVDLVIDAAVSMSVRTWLDIALAAESRTCHVAQVATDVTSATLGILAVVAAGDDHRLATLDEHALAIVTGDPELEGYRCVWDDNTDGQVVPTLGCSVPTFRGSAADASAIAATALSLLGRTLSAGESGVHVFGLPYGSHAAPAHRWIKG